MRDMLSNSEEFAIVSPYELLESRYISILGGMGKVQVIACHWPHRELCRVRSQYSFKSLWRATALWKQLILCGNRKRFPLLCHLEVRVSLHHDLAGHLRVD